MRFLPKSACQEELSLENKAFLETLAKLAKECDTLVTYLVKLILMTLDNTFDTTESLYSRPFSTENYTSLKTLFYPPLPNGQGSDRLLEHTGIDKT